MSRKQFLVKVELEIQKVTCPGVCLCTNGKVSLQLYMLDSRTQTKSQRPSFPILYYEKFNFFRTFCDVRRLNELQRALNNEWFYAELIQWQNCEEGCVLATFQTTLDDLLYPGSVRGTLAGADLDLLMEPTILFPGKISPKLEIGTKTTIEETFCDVRKSIPACTVVNPKTLVSTHAQPSQCPPRRVCHSLAFQRAQKNLPFKKKVRPIFKYQKPEDDLILRTNPNVVIKDKFSARSERKSYEDNLITVQRDGGKDLERPICACYCRCRSKSQDNLRSYVTRIRSRKSSPENLFKPSAACLQRKLQRNREYFCPVCAKYDTYFTSEVLARESQNNTSCKLCALCKKNEARKFHVRSETGSPCRSDSSTDSKKACLILSKNRLRTLSDQLHERLRQSIQTNSRLVQNCINCDD